MKRRRILIFAQSMITIVIIFTGFLGATSVEGAVSTPAFCTDLFKLMPLGDSITVGKYSGHDTSNDPGAELDDIGYRKDLWDLLSGPWYSADFVGSASNGATFPFGYPEHEGHNGINADLVRDNLFGNGEDNWLNQNPPDVILLHIGTNDVNSPQTIDQIVEEVEEILDKIDAYQDSISPRKEVIVILAKIIDQVPHNQKVTDFNVLLEGMAKARSEFEIELYLVDMESGAGIDYANYSVGGDMYDKNHPYASGFNKMAKVWMRKIDEICGNLPQLVNPGGQISEEGDNISLELITNGSDIYSLTFSQSDLPPGLSINSSTGRISGTISNGAQSGSPYDVTVTLAYDYGEIDQVNFTWTVYQIPNTPPTVGDVDFSTVMNTPLIITETQLLASSSDADGDLLSINSFDATSTQGGTITGAVPGPFIYTPPTDFTGDDSFNFSVFDGTDSTQGTANIQCYSPNTPPTVGDVDFSTVKNTPLIITEAQLLVNSSDADGDLLSVNSVDATSIQGGTITGAVPGPFTYTPPTDFTGYDSYKFLVFDGTDSTQGTANIQVKESDLYLYLPINLK